VALQPEDALAIRKLKLVCEEPVLPRGDIQAILPKQKSGYSKNKEVKTFPY
jgi:hypothetical protein